VTDQELKGGEVPRSTLGDPNCPHCQGSGYLRKDLAPGHPDFGRIEVCICRQADVQSRIRERLFSLSHLDELRDLTFDTFNSRGRIGLGQQQQDAGVC